MISLHEEATGKQDYKPLTKEDLLEALILKIS
jgi:hypothetical protein